MKVILAEKPSVAKTIASFLKANTRRDGYFEGNGYIVTYAFGHLVSLYDMKDYDKEKYSGSWKKDLRALFQKPGNRIHSDFY